MTRKTTIPPPPAVIRRQVLATTSTNAMLLPILLLLVATAATASTTIQKNDNMWEPWEGRPTSPSQSLYWTTNEVEADTGTGMTIDDIDDHQYDNRFPHRSLSKTRQKAQILGRKPHEGDFHFPADSTDLHRIVVKCRTGQSQDDCLHDLRAKTKPGSFLRVVHNLEAIRSFSIQVDTATRDNLFEEHVEIHRDFVRRPLMEMNDGADNERQKQPIREHSNVDAQTVDDEITWNLHAIRAPEVWDKYNVQGKGGKICLLDTGVYDFHEDLYMANLSGYNGDEAVSPWWDDRRGHGTHVCGTIAAAKNGYGIVGVAPDAEVFVVRVFDEYGEFLPNAIYSSDLIAAAQICRNNGANVISASLGGPTYNAQEDEFFSLLFDEGILTVAAAGNSGDADRVYPAAYDKVLSVGASDESGRLARFSTLNQFTDVLAPGTDILSTYKDNGYRSFSGSSFSAPHVSAAVALMISRRPNATSQELFDAIKGTAVATADNGVGRESEIDERIGILDVALAMECLIGDGPCKTALESRKAFYNSDTPHCSAEVHFDLVTDDKGNETAYRLMRLSDGEVIWLTQPDTLSSDETYSVTSCLEDAVSECYRFDIRDTGGDGIDGVGVNLFFKGHELYRGGNFGRGGSLTFGDGCC